MSSVRYYVDEHVGNAVVQGLRQRGVDILTVVEAGMLSTTDEAQLAFALNAGRVIFTQDGDFLRLAASGILTPVSCTYPKVRPLDRSSEACC